MGVSTSTYVKFFTNENQFVKKYYLDDRSDDYIYQGLLYVNEGEGFEPENFGEFTEEQKEIMKVYFDEESESVLEGYAKVTRNIQSPDKLLPIWEKIRSSIIAPFQQDLNNYHNQIIADYTTIKREFENYDISKEISLPKLTELKSNFKNILWETIWKIDSISKVIALLIVANENNMLVEITAIDG